MAQDLYQLERLRSRIDEWRIEAELATLPEMKDFCLREARRCEEIVQRSFQVSPFRLVQPKSKPATAN